MQDSDIVRQAWVHEWVHDRIRPPEFGTRQAANGSGGLSDDQIRLEILAHQLR